MRYMIFAIALTAAPVAAPQRGDDAEAARVVAALADLHVRQVLRRRQQARRRVVVDPARRAVLGIAMGLAFGVTLQRAIADEGVDVLAVPWVLLIVLVFLSAIAGILAALLPARRAGRLNVLEAITTE